MGWDGLLPAYRRAMGNDNKCDGTDSGGPRMGSDVTTTGDR
jgi:hypothetical protein